MRNQPRHFRPSSSSSHLLELISASGWTEEYATQFETAFGDDIRRLVVLHLLKLGLVAFRFDPSLADRILQGRCLELFENSVSDVWIALTRGLIRDYLEELGDQSSDDLPFLKYLTGAIRNITVDAARELGMLPRHSERSILKQLCRAKGAKTRKAHLARAMYQFQTKTERELLSHCKEHAMENVYKNLYRLVHHFFEQYVPRQCSLIQKLRAYSTIAALAKRYMESEYQAGMDYTGNLTPWDGASMQRVLDKGHLDQTSSDEEFLDVLALHGSKVMI